MKDHHPKASVLSHLKPKSGFSPATDAAFPTNPDGANLWFQGAKAGPSGSMFGKKLHKPGKKGKKL